MSSGTTTAGNTESCKDPALGHAKFRASGGYELVALIRVLRHLPDPEPALAQMARILRPGGYAVIEVANSVHAARRQRLTGSSALSHDDARQTLPRQR
jgi:SAM-dependent methyltransferase